MITEVSENGRGDNGIVLALSIRKGLWLSYLQSTCAAAVGKGTLKLSGADRVYNPSTVSIAGREGTFDEFLYRRLQ